MLNNLIGKTILITGGTGSWGQELTHQLLANHKPKTIRIYSRGEHKQVEMKRAFSDTRISFIIGDVRDKSRLSMVMRGVDVVFHLAALKHVPVCEENPWEAVQTNIIGTQNVIETAMSNNVKKVIYVSSDKAVDPFNLYGATKSCGEQLIIDANNHHTTRFVCIRAGNVIGTNGSVIPLFREQAANGNDLTITDERMTRFFMRRRDAIGLLIKAVQDTHGGEILVTKMSACKIIDVAHVFSQRLAGAKAKVKNIGMRPGEKLYEVLVSRYEVPHTYDLGNYFVILPPGNPGNIETIYGKKKLTQSLKEEYNSSNGKILTPKQVEAMLQEDGWI